MFSPNSLRDSRISLLPKIPTRNFLSGLLLVLAGFIVLLPAIVRGIPAGHDLPSHLRLALPFYDAIQSGNLRPGWVLAVNQGFGDPSLRFYPPGLYYLLAATRGLTGSW